MDPINEGNRLAVRLSTPKGEPTRLPIRADGKLKKPEVYG
jgi:hypothetical protein